MNEPLFNGPLAQMLRRAFRDTPNPWPDEIEKAVRAPEAVPLCLNCLAPQTRDGWFCPHCAFPTGDYVAVNPFSQIFVLGELFRRGVTGAPEKRVGVHLFLLVCSVTQYAAFAPVYWFWLWRRQLGRPICEPRREPFVVDLNA
ncbi:hypothetical protein [Opitutus terrae]|uniref:Uncharacterized protein n=1 Tax=Opitutus terrae (strain DSM 11246 / JCM 15787 / PB90-1) TaxID=452637 RepID=B1ZWD2_OPITP|nr:hypothetical protein [Opitutus terrae]ACB76884.1 hypothetical protein Oter_3607 [Opitutus terrae PB90-1]